VRLIYARLRSAGAASKNVGQGGDDALGGATIPKTWHAGPSLLRHSF